MFPFESPLRTHVIVRTERLAEDSNGLTHQNRSAPFASSDRTAPSMLTLATAEAPKHIRRYKTPTKHEDSAHHLPWEIIPIKESLLVHNTIFPSSHPEHLWVATADCRATVRRLHMVRLHEYVNATHSAPFAIVIALIPES